MTVSPFPTRRLSDSEVATLVMGQSPSSETYNTEHRGLPFYQGKSDFGLRHPTPRIWCAKPLRIAEKNDTLVSVRAPVGDVNLANERCCLGRGVAAVHPANQMNPAFLYFALAASKPHLAARSTGTTFESVNKTALEELEIAFPPVREQEKIAAVLWKAQRAIEVEEKLVSTMRELKQSAMRQLFRLGLYGEPQKETDIGPLPESWNAVALGSLGRIGNGSTPLKRNLAYWTKGTIPWLASAKVYDVTITEPAQFVTPTAVEECHLPRVSPGSVLVAITGQGKTLGHAAVTAIETCVSQHIAYLQFSNQEANPHFIRLFLESRYDELRGIAQGGGSTKGALTCGFLKTYVVPLPHRTEQNTITTILMVIEEKISVHERKRATLHELFETLLHQLMTCQIRVDGLDIDTSEVTRTDDLAIDENPTKRRS